jgi:tryptophan-rich sensory protein
MNYRALGVAIALCLAVAALEGTIGADGVVTWYPTLKKPAWYLPMAAFIAIGMLVYLIREEKGEM